MTGRPVRNLRAGDKIKLSDGGFCEVRNTDPALRKGFVLVRYRILTGEFRGGAFQELVPNDKKVIPA